MKQEYDVIAMGELLIDFTCEQIQGDGYPVLAAHPGGAPANFLCTLSKYGAQTALIGKVGEDAFGYMLESTMEMFGVDTCGLVRSGDVFTTLAFVTLDKNGEREFSFARKPGADIMIYQREVRCEMIDRTKIFHFGTLSLTDEPARSATVSAVEYARQKKKLLTFDPNLRMPLWRNPEEAKKWMLWGIARADVVKLSDEEAEFLFGERRKDGETWEEFADRCMDIILKEYQTKLVFLTLGKDGCRYANAKARGSVPGLEGIRAIDATGAGDIFGGAAVSRLLALAKEPQELEKEELDTTARFACAAAGLSTARRGGISSIPELKEIIERI